jgi:LPXTG-motif cell wall-anchored protein
MRKFLGTLGVVGLAVTGAVAAVAAPAGAQTTPLTCTFTVTPTTVTIPQNVTVSGTAPGTTQVVILRNGTAYTTVQSDPVTGAFGPVQVLIETSPTTIAIQLPDPPYGDLPCIGNGAGETVQVAAAATALPRTGSDTSPYVLTAVALIGVGAALVIGARRRRNARTHV